MKFSFKQTKVVYNAVTKTFEVHYKNWFTWTLDSSWPWDENPNRPCYYSTYQQSKDKAIERATDMLESRVIWKGKGSVS